MRYSTFTWRVSNFRQLLPRSLFPLGPAHRTFPPVLILPSEVGKLGRIRAWRTPPVPSDVPGAVWQATISFRGGPLTCGDQHAHAPSEPFSNAAHLPRYAGVKRSRIIPGSST